MGLDVDCGIPPEIPNGRFSLASNVTYYGSAVLYECDSHYELDGHARRLCLENGTWSSETPSCKGMFYIHYFICISSLFICKDMDVLGSIVRGGHIRH